jgi:hypothetical protein
MAEESSAPALSHPAWIAYRQGWGLSFVEAGEGSKVPFRDYSGFSAETLRVMTAAYDAAMAKLQIKVGDPRTSNIAAKIAALAAEGERDPAKLCEQAIAKDKSDPGWRKTGIKIGADGAKKKPPRSN